MALSTLTEDLLAIFIFLSGGHIYASLAEVLSALEVYQDQHNRHFGISPSDMRGLLIKAFLIRQHGCMSQDRIYETLRQTRLSDIALTLLGYQEAYFNDEGEFLVGGDACGDHTTDIASPAWTADQPVRSQQTAFKQAVKILFSQDESLDPKDVLILLAEFEVDGHFLERHSRAGCLY